MDFVVSLLEEHVKMHCLLQEEESVVRQKAMIVKYREEIDA